MLERIEGFNYTEEHLKELQISIGAQIQNIIGSAVDYGFDAITVSNYIVTIAEVYQKSIAKQAKVMARNRKKFEEKTKKLDEKYSIVTETTIGKSGE